MTIGGNFNFKGADGTEKVVISKCYFYAYYGTRFSNCNATVIQSQFDHNDSYAQSIYAQSGSNVTCINSTCKSVKCDNSSDSNNGKFDIQNCVLWGTNSSGYGIYHSSIKNTIIYAVLSLDGTNTSSHCLVKEGCSGFADSWYIQVNPNQYDTEAVSWADLFSNDFQLTEDAAATYHGTDGTQVGIYGGMYPYNATPDYPLVKKLDVIGSHKDGKLNVKINVE